MPKDKKRVTLDLTPIDYQRLSTVIELDGYLNRSEALRALIRRDEERLTERQRHRETRETIRAGLRGGP